MANVVVSEDQAFIATWAASDVGAVRLKPFLGGKCTVQFGSASGNVDVSNDGENWDEDVLTVGGANEVVTLDPAPLYVRSAGVGAVTLVGWLDK